MMAENDSDDDDTFVTIGTALEPLAEDEVRRKPPQVTDQTVRDEKGRQRFHGAFTGGFSAGFWNTVGSKEGWTPSTFVSSRSQREERAGQRPEDFMDEEDLKEHGIAPRQLSTTEDFRSTEQERKRRATILSRQGGTISAAPVLEELVVPAKLPIGIRLLRKMGWKEGQGVGPRVKRNAKRQTGSQSTGKVYGCALPASNSESEDEYSAGLTFAPKDTTPITFSAKDNVHGIGYSGINPHSALGGGHINLFEPPPVASKTGKKGITGVAFGIGALEDEDDMDIYAADHMSRYDTVLTGEGENTFGWTAPKHKTRPSRFEAIEAGPSSVTRVLEGFTLASKPMKPKKIFPPPKIPKDFRAYHVFKKPSDDDETGRVSTGNQKLDAVTRGAMLGEKPMINSVFDLVSKEDKNKMEQAKDPEPMPQPPTLASSGPTQETTPDTNSTQRPEMSGFKPFQLQGVAGGLKPAGTGVGFKPFAKDPSKQARYESYLELTKHGNKDCHRELAPSSMTEWEREREQEEFARAATLYRPMSSLMASRFTSAKFTDDTDKVDVPIQDGGDKNDQARAAEMKMFGRLTRNSFEWHPNKLLCKRFNVPDPYPSSTIVGLPTVKRDKFSLFNFLNIPTSEEEANQQPPSTQKDQKAIAYKGDNIIEESQKEKNSTQTKKKGIFSHLGKKQNQQQTKSGEISLQGNSDTTQSGSALASEKETGSKVLQELQSQIPSGDERPPMDLFKAIFQDSDSSDTSDSEEDEEKDKTDVKDNVTEMSESKQSGKALPILPGTGSTSCIPTVTLEERLSPSHVTLDSNVAPDSADSYGPALPPTKKAEESIHPMFPSHVFTSKSAHSADEHRKMKHKHKDKDREKITYKKHKKEKKSKHKKTKHKHKHKTKKKKARHSSSSDDSDIDSDNEESLPSDREIIQKMKQVSSGQRMSAADFW